MSASILEPVPEELAIRSKIVRPGRCDEVAAWLTERGARVAAVECTTVATSADFFASLHAQAPFREQAVTNWDGFWDCIGNIADDWPFPVFVVLRDFAELVGRDAFLAMKLSENLSELATHLSTHRKQFAVLYELPSRDEPEPIPPIR